MRILVSVNSLSTSFGIHFVQVAYNFTMTTQNRYSLSSHPTPTDRQTSSANMKFKILAPLVLVFVKRAIVLLCISSLTSDRLQVTLVPASPYPLL